MATMQKNIIVKSDGTPVIDPSKIQLDGYWGVPWSKIIEAASQDTRPTQVVLEPSCGGRMTVLPNDEHEIGSVYRKILMAVIKYAYAKARDLNSEPPLAASTRDTSPGSAHNAGHGSWAVCGVLQGWPWYRLAKRLQAALVKACPARLAGGVY